MRPSMPSFCPTIYILLLVPSQFSACPPLTLRKWSTIRFLKSLIPIVISVIFVYVPLASLDQLLILTSNMHVWNHQTVRVSQQVHGSSGTRQVAGRAISATNFDNVSNPPVSVQQIDDLNSVSLHLASGAVSSAECPPQALRDAQLSATKWRAEAQELRRTSSAPSRSQQSISAPAPGADRNKETEDRLKEIAWKILTLCSPWPIWSISESFIAEPPEIHETEPGSLPPVDITANDITGDRILSLVPQNLHGAFLSSSGQGVVSLS